MARNQISSVAFGQVNSAVRILPGASVNVASASGASVTLYASEDGSETVANPFTCDALGRYEFFVSSSEISYTITVTLGPVSYTWVFYTPDNTAAAGLIYEETWSDLVGRSANLDGAAAEVTNDAGTHLAATDSGYDGGEVANLGRYRWNAAWGRWERLDDLAPVLFGQPYDSPESLEASNVPATISSVLVIVDGTVLSYVRSDDPADIQSADAQWWALTQAPITAGGTGASSAEGARVNLGIYLTADRTINIPTEYATLQEAIDGTRYLGTNGFKIYLNIETGHQPSSGIVVSDGDYRHYIVTSDDATVTVNAAAWGDTTSFIKATSAEAPVLATVVDMGGAGDHGYYLAFSSNGYVLEDCGVLNAGGLGVLGTGAGLFLYGSCACTAYKSVFTGSPRNVWISHESQFYGDHGTYTGATGDTSVYIARSSVAGVSYADMSNSAGSGLRARRSLVTALAADASNAGTDGILAQEGSTIIANDQTVDPFLAENCGQHGVSCDKSFVDFAGGSTVGASGSGIRATNGARVVANGATLSTVAAPSSYGINAESSNVVAQGVVINSPSSVGILAAESSTVDATGCTISAAGGRAVDLSDASRACLKSSSITGSTSDGVRCTGVSLIHAGGATISGSGSGFDMVVQRGGQISASSVTTTSGSPSASDTNVASFNAATANGTIWT